MKTTLARVLQNMEVSLSQSLERQRVTDQLFIGLNKKLEPLGLTILRARVGWQKVDARDMLAKLESANIV